ncbi:hypothetical protein DCC81_04805 [Chitinophaga parva]|uniref:DUF5977 domain-containing protein n=1 Tax=Chitinophaga parva TaxID=2169414 RepID=A0A2T7BMA1_9BACT|nr:DUF5977 domain-containing protein [Chitinophaga parva]PUZ28808.1 hypothetical protein DCC81_04805 [Chitinophaga parva]
MLRFKKQLPILMALCALLFVAGSCRRHDQFNDPVSPAAPSPQKVSLKHMPNPFSLRNVQLAMQTLNRKTNGRVAADCPNCYPTYVYYRINPANVDSNAVKLFRNDTSMYLNSFPFGDGGVYNDTTLTEDNIAQLEDGNLYGIAPFGDTTITRLKNMSALNFTALDTLVLLPDSSQQLAEQSMRQVGMNLSLRICLLKKPHGYVRTADDYYGSSEPVRGIKVWALAFGIPVSTHTDGNGYYEIGFRFSIGSIMGTEANSSRVNIRPLDFSGPTGSIDNARILANLLIGSVHTYGGVSACRMGDGLNITFSGHTQQRYWAHILNAYYFHDQYCAQENILPAPSGMTVYAIWNKSAEVGSASTMMMGHASLPIANVDITNWITGFVNPLGSTDAVPPLLSNAIRGWLPDQSFQVGVNPPPHFSTDFTQIAFHELGHASQYRQVGGLWYSAVVNREINNGASNPYGNGTETNAIYVGMSESWAEFIGNKFATRRYPNGTDAAGTAFSDKLETRETFKKTFIPSGLYYDLMDATNTNPVGEPYDNATGLTINRMYYAFGPSVTSWCSYVSALTASGSIPYLWPLLTHYNIACGNRYLSTAINTTLQKQGCSAPSVGSMVAINFPEGYASSTISQADANAQAAAAAQAYANAQGTCIGGVYVKLTYLHQRTLADGTQEADITLNFFSDPAGTIPYSVSGLTVNVVDNVLNCPGGNCTPSTNNYHPVATGAVVEMLHQAEIFYSSTTTDDYRSHDFEILPGAGYTAIN